MSKKTLIIVGIIVVVLIAGGVTLGLTLANKKSNEQTAVPDKPVCTLVARESIATALGVDASAIGEPVDQGQVNDPDGTTRTCFYQLGVKSNSLYSNVTITATTFNNEEVKGNAISRFAQTTKPKTVDGLTTYFSSVKTEKVPGASGPSSSVPAQNSYRLYVFKDSKVYTYGLVNPSSKDVFKNKAEAETALSGLVRAADL